MEWLRKSRNSQIAWVMVWGGIWLFPQILWAYGYYYMKDYRERANRSAATLYISEDRNAPKVYEEMGPIKKTGKTREACIKRLRRQAWRNKADGIVQIKYSAETLSNEITCEGVKIRWKPTETQGAETQQTETQQTETQVTPSSKNKLPQL
jgi:uncharacterized protein YbjQ (UPF0145 family)